MTLVPHEKEIRNPKWLFIHYSNEKPPVVEVYREKYVSEYVAAGFSDCLNTARDECHLIHPHAPYTARA